jgi:ribosomal protein S18 acetylase RimI-like enzyme
MTGSAIAMAELLEGKLLHVWPSVDTIMREGWAIRLANGYSGRSNSASALVPGAKISEALLHEIEGIYRNAKQPSQFRLSPLVAPETWDLLASRGYRLLNEALTMSDSLTSPVAAPPNQDLLIESTPSPFWLTGVTGLNDEPSKRNPANLKDIVGRLKVPAAFATAFSEGKSAGFGVLAIHEGWAELGSIVVAPSARGKGLGRALVTGLLAWAQRQGADHAFLQVDTCNGIAINLYRSLGFEPVYHYATLRKAM